MLQKLLLFALLVTVLTNCGEPDTASLENAPAYYRHHPVDEEAGRYLLDSLGFPGNLGVTQSPVRDWTYTDQRGRPFSHSDLRGKVYIADFFFTSCPTICPKVKSQMLRIMQEFSDEPDFAAVSFTIDPKRDTPEKMLDYATKLGIEDMDRWRFLDGPKLEIYELDADYMSIAEENAAAPGGFDHSGYIVLVDREGRVRSYGSGLDEEEVDHLMDDIRILLDQEA